MKILIISSSAWDVGNSFGNTFNNIFCNMENIEIFNIACHHGSFNDKTVSSSLQMTDRSVLASIYKTKFDPCWRVDEKKIESGAILNTELSVKARKNKRTIAYMARDIIWKLGRWKKSRTLANFLDEIKPDVIYLPIYASPYMCDVQAYIIKKLNIPVVGHISDDVYGCPPKCSPLGKIYRAKIKKKVAEIIGLCSYLEVFAENMQKEYSELFDKPCYLIGKGIQINAIDAIQLHDPVGSQIRFVYTGNIGDDRYKALVDIGNAISETFDSDSAVLDLYSTTPLTRKMSALINGCRAIKFHGGISREEVINVQQNADFLVHVEGFSQQAIFSSKMSFSTKIIDYMTMGKPILAYGPKEVNSIWVLKKNHAGLTATTPSELASIMNDISIGKVDYNEISENVKQYLLYNRNIAEIQKGIYQRLNKLVEKNENSTN